MQDPDFWWHLASGRDILFRQSVPHVDPFSWTAHGTSWVNSYWLYDSLLYGLYTRIGTNGLLLVHAGIVLLIFLLFQRILIRKQVRWPIQLLALTVLFLGGAPGGYWGPQSSLVSLLFFVVVLAILDRQGHLSARTLFLTLPCIFLLWANMHRGFVIGIIVLLGVLAERVQGRDLSVRQALAAAALCGGATLLNPFGIYLYGMIRDDFFLSSERITGWAPMSLAQSPWLILTIAAIALTRTYRLRFLLLVIFGIGSLKAIVFVPYFLCMAWITIASALQSSKSVKRYAPRLKRFEPAGLALAGIVLLVGVSRVQPALGVQRNSFPVDLPAFIESEEISGRLFNDYRMGGFSLWSWNAALPVFIDGRYPAVEGYKRLAPEVVSAFENPRRWQAFADRHGVDVALLTYRERDMRPTFLEAMMDRKTWALVYWDDVAALYLRRIPAQQSVIRRNEFLILQPDDSPATFVARLRAASPTQRTRLHQELQRALANHPQSQRIAAMENFFRQPNN